MRVVIAPNAFRGGPSAQWVADALGKGIRGVADDLALIPLSDGGDGALAVAEKILGGTRITRLVRDPLGRLNRASYLLLPDGRAFIETAEASGLHLVADQDRSVLTSTTYGTGQLMADAFRRGARRCVVSAGGTASVDMGAGALAALGARFLDADGRPLRPVPRQLTQVRRADLSTLRQRFPRASVLVLSDVMTTLDRNLATFGPQKGIGPGDAAVLRAAMARLSAAMGQADGSIFRTPLMGAGGGLAAGLFLALAAEVASGSDYFMTAAGLGGQIRRADLVLTAEGRFDRGSLDGKLPYAVASLAARLGKPAVIITGDCQVRASLLPPGVRCQELGLGPPGPGDAQSPERERALMLAARRAVEEHGAGWQP